MGGDLGNIVLAQHGEYSAWSKTSAKDMVNDGISIMG